MDRPPLIRGLRIAWSAGCGIVCVLQIVLWVRSYWRADKAVWVHSAPRATSVSAFNGHFEIDNNSYYGGKNRLTWSLNRSAEKAPILWRFGLAYSRGRFVAPIWL